MNSVLRIAPALFKIAHVLEQDLVRGLKRLPPKIFVSERREETLVEKALLECKRAGEYMARFANLSERQKYLNPWLRKISFGEDNVFCEAPCEVDVKKTKSYVCKDAGGDFCAKADDPCKKKEDPCAKKKENPCGKKKEDPCAKKKEDPCGKKKQDPCAKKKDDSCGKKKQDPCAKKKDDPCGKKKQDPCAKKKGDPCGKKKEDPCKKKKDDPCGKKKQDPCAKKKEDPCGKKKEDPCKKKKENPCKKKTDDPCKKKKEDPCKTKKPDSCQKKKEDPCKKKEDPCKKKCSQEDDVLAQINVKDCDKVAVVEEYFADCYKNKQFYTFNKTAYYDLQVHMKPRRSPQPSAKKEPKSKKDDDCDS